MKPLVVLFGWLGSQNKHLAKYDHIWKSLGAETLSFRPSPLTTAFIDQSHKLRSFLKKDLSPHLHEINSQSSSNRRPIFAHALSNAGFISLSSSILLAQQYPHTYQQILNHNLKGIIFDSCPCPPSPSVWARGFLAALLRTSSESLLPMPAIAKGTTTTNNNNNNNNNNDNNNNSSHSTPLSLQLMEKAAHYYLSLPSVKTRLDNIRHLWSWKEQRGPDDDDENNHINNNSSSSSLILPPKQLFLYSKADALIPYHDIETFIHQQKARGIDVTTKRWTDSGHCLHYRQHPDEYVQAIKVFIS